MHNTVHLLALQLQEIRQSPTPQRRRLATARMASNKFRLRLGLLKIVLKSLSWATLTVLKNLPLNCRLLLPLPLLEPQRRTFSVRSLLFFLAFSKA